MSTSRGGPPPGRARPTGTPAVLGIGRRVGVGIFAQQCLQQRVERSFDQDDSTISSSVSQMGISTAIVLESFASMKFCSVS